MKIKKWRKVIALLLIVCMTAIPKAVYAEENIDATYAYTWSNPEILKNKVLTCGDDQVTITDIKFEKYETPTIHISKYITEPKAPNKKDPNTISIGKLTVYINKEMEKTGSKNLYSVSLEDSDISNPTATKYKEAKYTQNIKTKGINVSSNATILEVGAWSPATSVGLSVRYQAYYTYFDLEIAVASEEAKSYKLTADTDNDKINSYEYAKGTVVFENNSNEEIKSANKGERVKATANPTTSVEAFAYKFTGWEASGLSLSTEQQTANPLKFEMPDADVSLKANFKKTGTEVTVTSNDYSLGNVYVSYERALQDGTKGFNGIEKEEGKAYTECFRTGARLQFKVADDPNMAYRPIQWEIKVDGQVLGDDAITWTEQKSVWSTSENAWQPYICKIPTITVTGSKIEVVAKFEPRPFKKVTVSSSDPNMGTAMVGTANATTSQEFVDDTVTITATPTSDIYALQEWKVISPVQDDSTADADKITITKTGENTATFTMINQPVEIQAVFYKAKKSSEKELKEVYLLDADDKEKVIGVAARSGTDWTITLPDTLTKDEANAYLSGQGAYLKLVASDDTMIGQQGAYQETGAADEAKWANGEVYCFNMTLNKPTTFTVTAENGDTQDYTITIVYTGKKPKLTIESSDRTSDTEAKAAFKTDTAGTYYYLYKKASEKAPTAAELEKDGLSGAIGSGNVQNLNLKSLDGSTAYKIYVLVKSGEGKLSDVLAIDIPSLGAYTIKKNPQSGGTVTVDKSRANAGEIITVTVKPNTGKRVDFLSYSTEEAGSAPVEITDKVDATTYTFEMPAANISIGCTWTDVKEASITGFIVNGVNGVINEATGTISIVLPYGTDLTSLKPTITLSGATAVSPASGTVVNLSSPVTYTVMGEDGTTKSYKVTAVTSEQPKSDKLWEDMLKQTGGSTDHTGKNTWWQKAKDMKKNNNYPKYW